MPSWNTHLYDLTAGIAYPVDDTATCLDDAGVRLPSNLLVDLNLRWPEGLGRYAFLSAVSVSAGLVTVAVQAADSYDDPGFTPLAVLSVPLQGLLPGRVYPVRAQAEGVGGWFVFGGGVRDGTHYARFSSPRQSLLAPRAARHYRPFPVTSVGVLHNAAALTGVVRLDAVRPLEVALEDREVGGVIRQCVVLRLTDDAGIDGFRVPANATRLLPAADNVFRKFAGPCGGRPESGTCGTPEPIEFINTVGPDCDGVLTIRLTGCADAVQIEGTCGVALDCGLGLDDACLAPRLPASDGRLPDEYEAADIPSPPPTPGPDDGSVSESYAVVGELPWAECFGSDAAPDAFSVRSGLWQVHSADDSGEVVCPGDDLTVYYNTYVYDVSLSASSSFSQTVRSGSYATNTTAARNVTVWDGFDASTVYRRVTTDAKMLLGPPGSRQNAGLVLNYRLASGVYVYYLAEMDYDAQEFRISRFNGTSATSVAAASVPGLQLDKWYRITATIVGGPGASQETIRARLQSVSDSVVDATLTASVSNYRPTAGGRFGFHANRSLARFAFLKVEEATSL
jgi:hypothetical protein